MTSHIDINEAAQNTIVWCKIKGIKMKQSSLEEYRKPGFGHKQIRGGLLSTRAPWGSNCLHAGRTEIGRAA